MGASVIIGSRNKLNGENAELAIKNDFPQADISVVELDLASFASIHEIATNYIKSAKPLHILINNAGVMACPKSRTADGFETQFGVNHLGHFYLTSLLLPVLAASATVEYPSRVINVSSVANILFAPRAGIKLDDVNLDKGYDPWLAYGQSKLANILFTNELQRRVKAENKNIVSVSLHPGSIPSTNLPRHISASALGFMVYDLVANLTLGHILKEKFKTIPTGAATTVLAALDPEILHGAYYCDCQVSTALHPLAQDAELAGKLWELSENLVAATATRVETAAATDHSEDPKLKEIVQSHS